MEKIMVKYIVTLTQEERNFLEEIASKGNHKSQKVLNALILLNTDEGLFQNDRAVNSEISKILKISEKKIDRVKKRFVEEGIETALNGHDSTRVYEKKADGDFEAHLIALSCSQVPEGNARWTLRLLADKAVELNYVDDISHETVRQVLKKTKSNHGVKNVG
jgi:phosphoribosyl-ATP pyrophosphohydrolase